MQQKIFRLFLVIVGLIILYVSISRTSLDLILKDERSNKLRNVPYELEIKKGENYEKLTYKLPETRVLPSNPFYSIKKIRDSLWINFTETPVDKARLLLLVADKKMGEVLIMDEKEVNEQMLIATMIESADKLKLAKKELDKNLGNEIEINEIKNQLEKSEYVWKEIVEKMEIEKEEKEKLKGWL